MFFLLAVHYANQIDRTLSDIWTKILSRAYTDSGSIGHWLSLASKIIREASAPVKLQSIAVNYLQKILALHELLFEDTSH